MSTSFDQFRQTSVLSGGNAAYIEDLYESFLQDPDSVSENWRAYFLGLRAGGNGAAEHLHGPVREVFAKIGQNPRAIISLLPQLSAGESLNPEAAHKQAGVLRLINAHRTRGHQAATLDPLALRERPAVPDLDLAEHGLSEADLDAGFDVGSLQVGKQQLPLREILELVRRVYTGNIGSEYMHIHTTEEKRWIQHRLEGTGARLDLNAAEKKELLDWLVAAEGLEKYLHTKYVGQKRFSLEGGDSLIPMMDALIQHAGASGAKEIVIGMAHRGRLNMLVNILGKAPAELFKEFEGKKKTSAEISSGDVKYHMGFSSDVATPGGVVHLALAFNPSHLEIVNPVVEGSVRARLERRKSGGQDSPLPFLEVLPVLIHGDAAFAGQGVNQELFQMASVRGYRTGGTVHIVVNNQIGFTTSNPLDVRSSTYCTDVAKIIQAPVFHVNGDDPEAVLFVTKLAMDYRTTFGKDVVIDLVCYRRHGHNEADEPSATQPMMYKKIKARSTAATLYAEQLVREGVLADGEFTQRVADYRAKLDAGIQVSRPTLEGVSNPYAVDWAPYKNEDWSQPGETGFPMERLQQLAEKLQTIPDGHEPHARVAKIVDDRRKMAAGALALDWGFAENMAYATLLEEGFQVRVSGEDCGRGTFFHRHAVLHSVVDGSAYIPLANVRPDQPTFTVIDSILSEEAVLGFEYGYATAEPNGLIIWEAQFGDFANGAQVVIDQFISSGQTKWGRLCGLVMLLPHGFEGQGPEHSSARLERYLQLCAEHNMQVIVPSTPAQCFHMLRRQCKRSFRKPAIVMSPKSLLRHRLAVNTLEDLANGRFQEIIPEIDALDPAKVTRIVFCSGKVYYDLLEKRREQNLENVAVVRIEQLYPFPKADYDTEIARYPNATDIVWCQEEPQNQGAWYQSRHHLEAGLSGKHTLSYAGRAASASPAVGSHQVHVEQQTALVSQALGL
ncbi:2-oxoglutarate dehydrogenase E1 component [Plasticicumulans sp.]|uniref:2-oxoglutarate dehydrogenase E1 component n=1 Tax=Plasticicumulans sp. TaxID=2307179 RepID=UPI002CFC8B12|nr:2-oxoglutarate dehydrogenase E1 component [Plasticicumulans sp.]MBS0601884.1 2-oxoglutarate dehydrogenase E1 component [Pseudomonadota bacterium]HMV38423.1 2-oxoglutarate dehydrogenase E1 component [Plasticicumulans sp.]HMW29711.1 2-oxoglutarate dehydrogenase E1 component [Plasticicumulans sp.]HMW42435.1 2-oxoglutarate dehydrogenase E1 component [Plasticicumulans sp.]HMZ09647.1 2-oxoglutarate dehydrogenase E1 component [Plasticicumulans sp.]